MYRIALNVAISWFRAETRKARTFVPAGEAILEVAAAPAESKELEDGLRVLWQAIHGLDSLDRALGIELVLGIVTVLLTGSFVADHVREPRFLVPGLVLHLCVIAQIAMLVRHTVATRQIDFGAPIVELHRRIEALRVSMIRTTMGTILLAALRGPALGFAGREALDARSGRNQSRRGAGVPGLVVAFREGRPSIQ